MKYKFIFAFFGLLTLSLVSKILIVADNNIAFTPDQARDMLEIRHLVITGKPKLVGPITDIIGLYLGPFWYYFNVFPFIVSGGNPLWLVYWQIFWFHLAVLIFFVIFKQRDKTIALVGSALLLFSPIGSIVNRYSWNANAAVFLTLIYFTLLLLESKKHRSVINLSLGIIAGLVLQTQAAFGILLFPFAFAKNLHRSKKAKTFILLGFLLTLIPQIMFEISHKFIMTKSFVSEFLGSSNYLRQTGNIILRLANRREHLISIFQQSISLPFVLSFTLLIISIVIYFRQTNHNKKLKNILIGSLQFVLFSFIFYFLFPFELKDWYLYGLTTPIIISFSVLISYLFRKKHPLFKLSALFLLIFPIFIQFRNNTTYLLEAKNNRSDDPGNLKNQLEVIDLVYQQSDSQGFSVYSYLPSVYDYNYQYLFWWYGTKKYHYQPQEIAYLPEQPPYVKDNPLFWQKQKPIDINSPIFLIIQDPLQSPERTATWLSNFDSLCLIGDTSFPWRARIEKKQNCSSH